MMAIRPVQLTDAHALAVLHALCFADDPWTVDSMRDSLNTPGTCGWVACGDDVIHGVLLLRGVGDESEVITCGVHPAQRQRGVARALFASAFAALPRPHTVFLDVAADNDAALALYRGLGFEPVATRRAYYARAQGPVDALVFCRKLC